MLNALKKIRDNLVMVREWSEADFPNPMTPIISGNSSK
jgi:hypothetical protein